MRRWALPVLQALSGGDIPENHCHLQALLHLMSNVRDTNLLARGGAEGLAYVQTTAQKALALGGALTPEGMDYLHALDRDYTRRNLSPGGCADLLAAAFFLQSWELAS